MAAIVMTLTLHKHIFIYILGLSGGSIAGIVTGVMALVITVIIILVMRWKPCPFQNTETFSNVMP